MNLLDNEIAIIGLGYVGLPLAVGHNQFRSLSAKELRGYCNGSTPVIGDIKSIYDKEELIKERFSVFKL